MKNNCFAQLLRIFVTAVSLILSFNIWANVTLVDTDTRHAIELYQNGNTEEAVSLFSIKAYEGIPIAQYNLAAIYFQDQQGPLRDQEVEFWLKKSAASGDPDGQFNLAMLIYQKGDSTNKMDKTVKWLSASAHNGHQKAQYNLGLLAFSNLDAGVTREKALEWLNLAAKSNNDRAKKLIRMLDENLSEGLPELYLMEMQFKTAPPDVVFVIRHDKTELYAFPATRQKSLQILERGTVVEIINRRNDWLGVRIKDGFPSWVHQEELTLAGTTATVSGLEASLYVEPVLDQEVFKIGVANAGETLQILEFRDDWVKVVTPEHFLAWVKESNIVKMEAGSNKNNEENNDDLVLASIDQPSAAELPKSTTTELNSDSLEISVPKVKVKSLVDQEIELDTWHAVYDGSSDTATLLGIVTRGSGIKALETKGKFSRIAWSGGLQAWIFGKFLEVKGNKGRVNTDNVRVRVLPNTGTSAAIIKKLPPYEVYEVTDSKNGWYQIVINPNGAGWVKNL